MKPLYFETLPGELLAVIRRYMAYSSPTDGYRWALVSKTGKPKEPNPKACVLCQTNTRNTRLPLRWRRRYAEHFDPKGATPLCFECFYKAHRSQLREDYRDSRRYVGVAHPGEKSGTIVYLFEDQPAINLLSTSQASDYMTVAHGKYCIDIVKKS